MALVSRKSLASAEEELRICQKNGVRILSLYAPGYPIRLASIPDSPLLLYQAGAVDWDTRCTLAVVGTRKPSVHGLEILQTLLQGLEGYKPLVISGLAFGIDAAAHRFSLNQGIATAAVIAHGLGHVYPADHRNLAEAIARDGALLTEYPWRVRPEKEFFPMRNRLIAGLADGLLVVETAERGGSMITAQLASDYHREVMAVPGRLTDKWSAGCLKMIRDQEASLVTCSRDIARILHWEEGPGLQLQLPFPEPEERLILDLFSNSRILTLTYLSENSGMATGALTQILLEMECKGYLREIPGKRYKAGA